MESFWKKELVDGTIELGTDTMVNLGQASWTKGRQDIAQVMLYFAGRLISIQAQRPEQCKWRLLDRNICSAVTGRTTRVQRILEVSFDKGQFLSLKKIDVTSSVRHTVFELTDCLGQYEDLKECQKVLVIVDQSGTLEVRHQ